MKTVNLWLPAVPHLLKDIRSQLRRRKTYMLLSPRFQVDLKWQTGIERDMGHQRIKRVDVQIVGSYHNRVLFSDSSVMVLQDKYTTAHEWVSDDFKIVKIGEEEFILMGWPKLKTRPFPSEEFHLVISFEPGHSVKIPYFATKL